MLKLLREVFRTGEATHKYPFAPLEVAKDFRGKPEHNAVSCIACAACTIACPPNAISMETDVAAGTRTWSISYGRCIFCGRCEEACPTGAIALSPDFELAVARKEDLTKRAVFSLAACPSCGEPLAAAKEVAYVLDILTRSAASPEEAERARFLVSTCPACKRKHDVEQLARIGVERQMENR
ncbi:formate hydrogenlyase complex iron-sulfur subunit [Telmatospirillum siberiense]|uniref:Formate hydrogenlyase complex iron-sulfur subunit n=1 Tax=Telmatospirillum siberiense TaxID=382514 RepID=A0A2N3PPM7_9PROT|nr:formate hydrogenlyase complex iron-sulfur subunit [Telmatospirillum siberiense]PKU22363.1 formate hydrogenlyase complex iron-sulfur subunit [Telmatospirillum siberiense]